MVLMILIAFLASAGAEAAKPRAADPAGVYEVCRTVGGAEECIAFASDCKSGLKARGMRGSAPVKCQVPSCPDLKEVFIGTAQDVKALPSSERSVNPGPVDCNHFRMDLPGVSYTACIGKQKMGARALFELFSQVEGYCR